MTDVATAPTRGQAQDDARKGAPAARAILAPTRGEPLAARLETLADGDALRADAAAAIAALARAAAATSGLVARGPLAGDLGRAAGADNADGDAQKALDVMANTAVIAALRAAPVAWLASEEEEAILTLDPAGTLAVAIDPLDGSSNIDVNAPIGAIFGIYPAETGGASASLLRPGRDQVAAGYVIYGPCTALVLSFGEVPELFVLDREEGGFTSVGAVAPIPEDTSEYAINASNHRHWRAPVRQFVEDCLAGVDGPRAKNFNMRWVASLVAEAHRILTRGGVFLYPGDQRKGYEKGRLRLLYEAAPMAFLVEAAGGMATDGAARILDIPAADPHQRTPLIFGAARKVARIAALHEDPDAGPAVSPLFATRGLYRA
ncbi:class 1 fructose-bisphosphatase [Rhodovulum sp. DZ06]|uniref:class 1 fructose-bisphosphatase n=1 Tax=Rhodovulum sp. DZ06 TaxID=3425126 RepID=UPI003D338AC4